MWNRYMIGNDECFVKFFISVVQVKWKNTEESNTYTIPKEFFNKIACPAP